MLSKVRACLALLFFVLFSGCAMHQPSEPKGYEKSFANEDIYILTALYAEEMGDYESASKIFESLYKESDKMEYFYRSLKNDMAAQQYEKIIQKADALEPKIKDAELKRFKVVALIRQNRLQRAKEFALKLIAGSKSIDDYLLVSDICVKLKEYEEAFTHLERAYAIEHGEKIVSKMAILLYMNLDRKKDAIVQLETHSRIYGCSVDICNMLAGFYSNENDIDALETTYLRMYKLDGNSEIAKKIVQIYGYKRDYQKMREFLQESKSDNVLLLQLYIQEKAYKKAAAMAQELYEESGDTLFLGQSAIFEYEGSEDKNDKAMHKSVIAKLKEVIEIKKDAMYLNYLGYLLIDHDVDVKKGIIYVQEALKIEPESAYYLDSLAWGYYKLQKCSEAAKIIKKVKTMDGADNEEVVKHVQMIEECEKIQKRKKEQK
ncbi:MAG: hypothetical protein PHX44_03895 [Sulfurimonas sp.]|uniref:tetratricopeptide repeat protein n=1 Tax=Sulfurimonas sp. TaxID=2022749 RepID=UPI002616B256|nr:hypothetical protein [Sulfurimonas sp.]MDD2652173.1 hypothetical protein [Sulfurimonas sp.]MDD3450544.1 hypothetical protein [Sulfurimonas sp.]